MRRLPALLLPFLLILSLCDSNQASEAGQRMLGAATLDVKESYEGPTEPIILSVEGIEAGKPVTFFWRLDAKGDTPEPGIVMDANNTRMFVWAAKGRYQVSVLVTLFELTIDWDARTYILIPLQQEYRATFEVTGDAPTPPTPPEPPTPPTPPEPPTPPAPPDIPADRFGAAREAHDAAVAILDAPARAVATTVADNYQTVADELESGQIPSLASAAQAVRDRNAKVWTSNQMRELWAQWGGRVGDLYNASNIASKQDVIDFYRCIALGLRHVK